MTNIIVQIYQLLNEFKNYIFAYNFGLMEYIFYVGFFFLNKNYLYIVWSPI
jgi:hypothetical protein